MPKANFSIPNPLGREAGLAKLTALMTKVRDRYGDQVHDLQESWNGPTNSFSFRTFGLQIAGQITVNDSDVQVQLDLPIAAMLAKGKIEQSIRDEVTKILV